MKEIWTFFFPAKKIWIFWNSFLCCVIFCNFPITFESIISCPIFVGEGGVWRKKAHQNWNSKPIKKKSRDNWVFVFSELVKVALLGCWISRIHRSMNCPLDDESIPAIQTCPKSAEIQCSLKAHLTEEWTKEKMFLIGGNFTVFHGMDFWRVVIHKYVPVVWLGTAFKMMIMMPIQYTLRQNITWCFDHKIIDQRWFCNFDVNFESHFGQKATKSKSCKVTKVSIFRVSFRHQKNKK